MYIVKIYSVSKKKSSASFSLLVQAINAIAQIIKLHRHTTNEMCRYIAALDHNDTRGALKVKFPAGICNFTNT